MRSGSRASRRGSALPEASHEVVRTSTVHRTRSACANDSEYNSKSKSVSHLYRYGHLIKRGRKLQECCSQFDTDSCWRLLRFAASTLESLVSHQQSVAHVQEFEPGCIGSKILLSASERHQIRMSGERTRVKLWCGRTVTASVQYVCCRQWRCDDADPSEKRSNTSRCRNGVLAG